MSQYVPLSFKSFKESSWDPFSDFRHAKSKEVIDVTAPEAISLSRYLPLVVAVDQHKSARLCALMGTTVSGNKFVTKDNKWSLPSSPALLRTEPFRILAQADDPSTLVLGVDKNSPWVSKNSDKKNRFFSNDGKPTADTLKVIDFLKELESQRIKSSTAVKSLSDMGLLSLLQHPDLKQTGLYIINEKKLNSLDDDSIIDLRRTGGLFMAYLILFSSQNIATIFPSQELDNTLTADSEDIDQLFGMQDDSIKFNF